MKFKIAIKDVKKLNLSEIAVLANIRRYATADDVTEYRQSRLIAEAVQMSERQVKTIIKKLQDEQVFTVKLKSEIYNGIRYNKNQYTFKPLKEMFVLVDDAIFESGLNAKEVGLLIRMKTLTIDNNLRILKNKEWIADNCGVTYTAFNKIFKSLEAKGFITYETNKLTLSDKLFIDCSEKVLENTKYRNMWINSANQYLQFIPASKESKELRYYFIDGKKPVKYPITLIKSILGCYNSKLREQPIEQSIIIL